LGQPCEDFVKCLTGFLRAGPRQYLAICYDVGAEPARGLDRQQVRRN
jgi:hypothetical protein